MCWNIIFIQITKDISHSLRCNARVIYLEDPLQIALRSTPDRQFE